MTAENDIKAFAVQSKKQIRRVSVVWSVVSGVCLPASLVAALAFGRFDVAAYAIGLAIFAVINEYILLRASNQIAAMETQVLATTNQGGRRDGGAG